LAIIALGVAACVSGGAPGSRVAFPRPSDGVSIVAAGDIADCRTLEPPLSPAAQTGALITASDAAVLTLGDNTYPVGAPGEYIDCFEPTWGRFKRRIFPSPGNHDYLTDGAAAYFDYYGAAAGPDRRGYYSFNVGEWHVISLNSNVDARAGSAQHAWLLAELAAFSGVLCTLAYWHHPVFSSGPHGNVAQMADVFAALHEAGVDVVLAGHDHTYERFAPQNAAGERDPARGIRSFVAGTGGAVLYTFGAPRPNSEVRDARTHGVLRLTLLPQGYHWEFIPVGGGPARDSGSDTCHR
jgi:3',5'-cyclic AMP phosphodiesterase CpdA